MIKKIFFISFITILVGAVGATIFFNSQGHEWVHQRLEKSLSHRLQSDVTISEVRFVWSWPLSLTVFDLNIHKPNNDLHAEVRMARISLGLSDIFFDKISVKPFLNLTLLEPKIKFTMRSSQTGPSTNNPRNWPTGLAHALRPVPGLGDLELKLEIKDGHLELFRQDELSLTATTLDATFSLASVQEAFDIEIKSSITPAHDAFGYPIPIHLKAMLQWKDGRLELVRNQFTFLNLQSHLAAAYYSATDQYRVRISSSVADLSKYQIMDAGFPIHDWSGSMKINLDMNGLWGEAPKVSGYVQLRNFQSSLHWGREDAKLYGLIKGHVEAEFDGSQKLSFKSLNWNLDLTDMNINLGNIFRKPTRTRMLTSGFAESRPAFFVREAHLDFLNLTWTGRGFMNPQGISHFAFHIPPFSLKGLEKYFPVLDQQPMSGTVEMNGEVVGDLNNLQYSQVRLRPLKIQNLNAFVDYSSKSVKIRGPLAGNFSLFIEGALDKINFWQSPMIVTGDIRGRLPATKWLTSQTEGRPTESMPKLENFAFFPDSKLVNNMNLQAQVQWDEFSLSNVTMKGINIRSKITQGRMLTEGDINNVFSGKVSFRKTIVPLTERNPRVLVDSSFSNINLGHFISSLFPQWKDLALGSFSGEVSASSLLPVNPQFPSSIQAKGKFRVNDGILHALPFDHMVKTTLARLPMIGNQKPLFQSPQPMSMAGQFDFRNRSLNLSNFFATTRQREEFRFNGTLDLDSNLSLKGQVFLLDAPVTSGFYRANKDALNRLVVPVVLQGPMTKPDLKVELHQQKKRRLPASRK